MSGGAAHAHVDKAKDQRAGRATRHCTILMFTPVLKRLVRRLPGFAPARNLLRGGDHRIAALLTLLRPRNLFQPYGETLDNRYPYLFQRVKDELGEAADLRLLSFGCSTGEEVFSLRQYFPQAHITGIDISRKRIATCHARLAARQAGGAGESRITFRQASSTQQEPAGHYDAIFALSVLRHGDLVTRPPDCGHILPFAHVAREIEAMARCLKVGGYLAIQNSNFRLLDTRVAADFDTLLLFPQGQDTPIYGADNRRVDGVTEEAVLFIKRR